MKKVCIITGTRAEYGLLSQLIMMLNKSKKINLQIIVTGSHLSHEHGYTINEIQNDGIKVENKIEIILNSDTGVGTSKAMGLGLISFSETLDRLQPDIIVILGDRFEALAAAISSTILKIPILHIHGGEKTEGAFDEQFRHSITKMSKFHFVATDEYRNRVIQLGEDPNSVFNVGSLASDIILSSNLLSKRDLSNELNIKFSEKSLLITYHPVTMDSESSEKHIKEILKALDKLEETTLIFTMPNSDPDAWKIKNVIQDYVKHKKNSFYFKSLGQLKYYSCLSLVDGVIGNSSSGIIEAPFFKKPTINIGDRQKGRVMSESIICCKPIFEEIYLSIQQIYSREFKMKIKKSNSLYGNGGVSKKIFKFLENSTFKRSVGKEFFDLI